jgi:hypothetical protein
MHHLISTPQNGQWDAIMGGGFWQRFFGFSSQSVATVMRNSKWRARSRDTESLGRLVYCETIDHVYYFPSIILWVNRPAVVTLQSHLIDDRCVT